jgi:protoheme IX farnesyltransferase
MEKIKRYYSLTKPGVLYGNAITGVAGFLLAAGIARRFELEIFLATIIGMTLIIASACVLNNFLDKDIDGKMERTKTRATVLGTVLGRHVVLFSIVLGLLGFAMLSLWTNWLVVVVGAIGFVDYVVLYGMLSKRLSVHGTLVGSISGAAPVLAGYLAVSGRIDAGAIIAFAILFFWQLPEFYSISIFRRDEYKAAGVPVMAVVKGVKNTKAQIYLYTAAFVTATLLLTAYKYTGYVYLSVTGLLGAYWLWLGAKGFEAKTKAANEKWARKMFRFSLVMVLAVSVMMSIGPLLP